MSYCIPLPVKFKGIDQLQLLKATHTTIEAAAGHNQLVSVCVCTQPLIHAHLLSQVFVGGRRSNQAKLVSWAIGWVGRPQIQTKVMTLFPTVAKDLERVNKYNILQVAKPIHGYVWRVPITTYKPKSLSEKGLSLGSTLCGPPCTIKIMGIPL